MDCVALCHERGTAKWSSHDGISATSVTVLDFSKSVSHSLAFFLLNHQLIEQDKGINSISI